MPPNPSSAHLHFAASSKAGIEGQLILAPTTPRGKLSLRCFGAVVDCAQFASSRLLSTTR
jgi:hypothetical protein